MIYLGPNFRNGKPESPWWSLGVPIHQVMIGDQSTGSSSAGQQAAQQGQQKNTPIMVTPCPTIGALVIKLCQVSTLVVSNGIYIVKKSIAFQFSTIQGGEGLLPQYGMTWNDMERLVWLCMVQCDEPDMALFEHAVYTPNLFMLYSNVPLKVQFFGSRTHPNGWFMIITTL